MLDPPPAERIESARRKLPVDSDMARARAFMGLDMALPKLATDSLAHAAECSIAPNECVVPTHNF
jgi:hypothetical protein